MVEVIGRSAPIPYVEARVGISIKICCFFGTGVKRVYAGFFWDRLSSVSPLEWALWIFGVGVSVKEMINYT
jgi:energy-converting hydrogenase Eha subunit G